MLPNDRIDVVIRQLSLMIGLLFVLRRNILRLFGVALIVAALLWRLL